MAHNQPSLNSTSSSLHNFSSLLFWILQPQQQCILLHNSCKHSPSRHDLCNFNLKLPGLSLHTVHAVQWEYVLFTKPMYAHITNTTVQFLSLLHISLITSPSAGSIINQVIYNIQRYDIFAVVTHNCIIFPSPTGIHIRIQIFQCCKSVLTLYFTSTFSDPRWIKSLHIKCHIAHLLSDVLTFWLYTRQSPDNGQ